MFRACQSLTTLDVSNWDTHNVTDMGYMFDNCSSLLKLDFKNWNVSKVKTFERFLAFTDSLIEIKNYEQWDLSSCENLLAFLQYNGVEADSSSGIHVLNLGGWDVSNVKSFAYMFNNTHLRYINGLNKWNTLGVLDENGNYPGRNFECMFQTCWDLQELDLSSFNTSNVGTGHTFKYSYDTKN